MTVVATTTAATADAAKTVRMPTCAAFQAITMPGKTARTTGGRIITKDLQGLGHLLGEDLGTRYNLEIEMEAVAGTKIAIGTAPDGQTGAGAKCPVTKTEEATQA